MDNEIVYTKGYESLRTELREELSKSVNSFVRIGYLLKVARDTNVLEESQYSNMEEFAYAEFKIDKGTASKFMAINDRFSEGGHSDHLKPEYNGIGWSKLSIMLQLPDSANEEISADFSKSEIQTLREEFAEAEKVTPMETLLEGETSTTAAVEDLLSKAIRQLGESEPEIFKSIHKAVRSDCTYDMDELKEVMAPAGEMIYSIRIRGVGRIMLSVKDHEETISMVNERTGEKETRTWEDLANEWIRMIDVEKKPEEDWENIYGQEFPKKPEVAPVQPKKETKVKKVNEKPKTEKAKQANVQETEDHAQSEEVQQQQLHDIDESIPKVVETQPEEAVEENGESEDQEQGPEPQIEGQTSIEEMPEVLPHSVNTECESKLDDNTLRGYKAAVTNKLARVNELWESDNPHKARLMLVVMEDMRFDLERLQKAEEQSNE